MKIILVAAIVSALSLPVLATGTTTTTTVTPEEQTTTVSTPESETTTTTKIKNQQSMEESGEESRWSSPSTAPAVDAKPSAPLDQQRMEDPSLDAEDHESEFKPQLEEEIER